MQHVEWISQNEEETAQFAHKLAQKLSSGDVLALEGDLGAGRRHSQKGWLKLGVTRMVNSPTFTIIKEYMGRLPLYHMDVYRVSESEEDLGFDEYFDGDGVTVVEWAHLIKDHLPEEILTIYIYRLGDTSRRIVLEAKGERYVKLCKEII